LGIFDGFSLSSRLREAKVRILLSVAALLGALASAANAGPKEDALQVVEKWDKAFADLDVDGIVKLYAPDALFMGTTSKSVVNKTEGIRGYFTAALQKDRPRVECCGNDYSAVILSETAVVISGLDTATGVSDGTPFSRRGRVTFVIAKRGPDWQIVQFHRSAMPN
jgi:uncharacterized protein (TIGR02246 family)